MEPGSWVSLKVSNIPLLAEEGWPRHETKYREASLLERTGWSGRLNLATVRRDDHFYCFALSRSRFAPVCAEKGGFAISLVDRATAHLPLLYGEGNVDTHKNSHSN